MRHWQNTRQPSKRDHDYAVVTDPILVPVDAENAARLPTSATNQHKVIDFAIEQTSDTPTITKDGAASCSIIGETIRNRKIPEDITEIITESWRNNTRSKYEAILKKWKQHTSLRNQDLIYTSVASVLSFLHGMYTKSCLYSVLCGARSALSSVVCIKGFSRLSDHPMISRYLKRMFNRHLPLPKYTQVWDINQILDYYTNLPDNEELEFKYIVKKLVMLFLILGARRKQALFTINIDNIIFADNKVIL